MLFDDIFQYIPYFRFQLLHHLLGILNVMSSTVAYQLFHNEGLEQLNCHLFRQTALEDLQFRSNYNNGTA